MKQMCSVMLVGTRSPAVPQAGVRGRNGGNPVLLPEIILCLSCLIRASIAGFVQAYFNKNISYLPVPSLPSQHSAVHFYTVKTFTPP